MKNITLVLLAFMLIFSTTYADNETTQTSLISSLNYDGFLNENTIINLNGSDFDKCDNLGTGSKGIEILTKNNYNITFKYSQLDKNSGSLILNCDGKPNSIMYSFPYIKSVSGIKDGKIGSNISISGENFGESSNLSGNDIVFQKSFSNDSQIVGVFNHLGNNEVYVDNGGFKSNLFKLDLNIPKITHVVGAENFKADSKIIIFGKNLNIDNSFKVLVGDTYIDNKKIVGNNIEAVLPKIYGSISLLVEVNGIKSNSVIINIDNKRPVINQIEEKQEEFNGTKQIVYYISGENFGDTNTTKLYINGNFINIDSFVSSNLIKIKKPDLLPGDNVFELTFNNKSSKIFNYYIGSSKLPELGGYEIINSDLINKTVLVYTSNFNQFTDKIYFNGSEVSKDNLYCNNNSCTFSIQSNILEGTFEIGRGAYKSPKKLYYDVKYESTPFISKIVFSKSLDVNTPFTIYGGKFAGSTISSSNFLPKDTKGNYDIRIEDDKITGYLTRDFNSSGPLTLNISNGSLTTNISFMVSDLDKNFEILGKPIIKEFLSTNEDGLFKPGVKVNIVSNNVSNGDVVTIGSKEIPVVVSQEGKYAYFILPTFDEFREYDVTVKNKFNQKSDNFRMIISDSSETNELTFESSSIETKIFNLDTKKGLDKPIYSFNITNKIKNLLLKNLVFKVKDYKNEYGFGTFSITVNGTKHPTDALINSNGEIIFNDIEILKSNQKIEIKLFKTSTFIEKVNFEINVDTKKIVVVDDKSFIYNNLNIGNFSSNSIKLSYLDEDTCIDTESSKINCNNYNNLFYQNNSDEQNSTINENPKVEEKPQIDKPVLNQNSDYFTLDIKTFSFKSKNYVNFNKQFKLYALKLQKQEKLKDNAQIIESSINGILESLYGYENSKNDKLRKKIYIQKLKFKVKEFKKAIK